jgi:hypothetical protein
MSEPCAHCRRRRRIEAVLVALAVAPVTMWAGSVGPLNTFVNGTVADADAVNANFATITAAVDDNDARLAKMQTAAATDPTDADDASAGFAPGAVWVNTSSRTAWVCVDDAVGSAVWREISPTIVEGSVPTSPGTSCKTINDEQPGLADGLYWIDPDGGNPSNAVQRWCDMTVDGGGWTLVAYNWDVSRTFLTGTYSAVGGQPSPTPNSEWASDPDAIGLQYDEMAFYIDDPQWDSPSRTYVGWWIGDDPASTYDMKSNACQLLRRTDTAQWDGQLVYFAGDGANDNGCSGGGSFFTSGHSCDDGGGGITTNNNWPSTASDPLWGHNCISSYSPTGAYKQSAISNQGLHAYYVR